MHFGLKYRKIKENLCKNSAREEKYTFLALFLCVYFTHQITFLCSSKDRVKVLSLVGVMDDNGHRVNNQEILHRRAYR